MNIPKRKPSRTLTLVLGLAVIAQISSYISAEPALAKKAKEKGDALQKDIDKAEARDNAQWSTGSVVIKASPEIVWQSVHDERASDPDLAYSKILEKGENESRLEQKFTFLPVIGTAVCEMRNWEVPLQRIDYKMIKSDRFKSMEGSWVLTPMENGQTKLELSTNLDMGLPVPRAMVNGIASKRIAVRLKHVKDMAESRQNKLAQSKKSL